MARAGEEGRNLCRVRDRSPHRSPGRSRAAPDSRAAHSIGLLDPREQPSFGGRAQQLRPRPPERAGIGEPAPAVESWRRGRAQQEDRQAVRVAGADRGGARHPGHRHRAVERRRALEARVALASRSTAFVWLRAARPVACSSIKNGVSAL